MRRLACVERGASLVLREGFNCRRSSRFAREAGGTPAVPVTEDVGVLSARVFN